MLRLFLLVACLCAALADHGDVCSERRPDHDSSAVDAQGNGGYFVFTEALDGYDEGRSYSVVLSGFSDFQEFLLFVQNETGEVQGTWLPFNSSTSTTVNCSGIDNSAVMNLNENSVGEQEFTWTAPAVNVGPISFIYTVISNNSAYVGLNASENRPPLQVLAAIPEGCDPSECDLYAAWAQNNNFDYVDFTLAANVQGWVALGLSADRVMGQDGIDDVLACQVDEEGAVNVKDTFNFVDQRSNLLDDPHIEDHNLTTQGILNVQTVNEGGHISCSFSRVKVINNPSQDRDLVLSSFLFFGLDPDNTAPFNFPLVYHDFKQPIVSEEQVSFNLEQLAGTPELVPVEERVATFPEPAETLGVFTIPSGCEGASCNYMARWSMDGDSLLFELSSSTSGWVAIAMSGDAQMSSGAFDDVIACQAEVGGATVNAKDMINPAGARSNELDTDQTGTQLISGEVTNGTLSCTVRRAILTSDTSQDYPLDQENYILFAFGDAQGDAQSILAYHGSNRQLTGPLRLTDRTEGFPPPPPPPPPNAYIRAHGILMLWSWLLLAASAIFYARYTRPAYVNGEWFEVHRAFLVASVLLTDVGFIVIFIGLSGFLNFGSSNPIGSAHFVIGCIVVGFQLYNPIIAAFRCHPGTKLRPIFDFIHGVLVGTVVELLAFINCALGLWRFVESSQHRHDEQFYIYITLLLVVIVFEVGMGFYHFVAKYIKPDLSKPPEDNERYKDIELTENVNGKSSPQSEQVTPPPKKKKPSKDALFRRVMAAVYSCVVIVFLVILTILVDLGVY